METDHPIDQYDTLRSAGEAKQKIKGSVFLALATPVNSEEEAESFIAGMRKKYYDSTHVGTAYRIAPPPDGISRYNDDGEPHGTTGPPILQAITGADLWGVCIGVVRWYGGTKLGTGGLIRAYGQTAAQAIANAPRKTVICQEQILVRIPAEIAGILYAIADKFDAKPDPPDFDISDMLLRFQIRKTMADAFKKEVIESTAARATFEATE